MKLTVNVMASDLDSLHKGGCIDRALARALLNSGVTDLEHVHVGISEVGFKANGKTWEHRLSKIMRGKLDWIIYGQAKLPQAFHFEFKPCDE